MKEVGVLTLMTAPRIGAAKAKIERICILAVM